MAVRRRMSRRLRRYGPALRQHDHRAPVEREAFPERLAQVVAVQQADSLAALR